MAFPSVSYTLVLPKPLVIFLLLLDCLRFIFSMVLHLLGFELSSDALALPWEEYVAYLRALDQLPPPVTSRAVISTSIKTQLPVVEFKRFSTGGEEPTCVVCMGELEEKDKVRELGNCGHVFHAVCIDKWVDMGHVTCPLCRSQLLPLAREDGKLMGLFGFKRFWEN
ncbi:brassinosteroid-responsive RING protein 1-like [Typha latifolia]|uniref:brassinosteroid-responsive RING protein 1-like n=1 Tax=Typha latifolia TaxID=4733 RepID=UPI003C2BD20F